MPEMVTIPNVTLCEVGTWEASTGTCTFTEAHLHAAVAAQDDPAIKTPRMRLGHSDPTNSPDESAGQFEEQPCVGKFTSLRVEDGCKLVGDLVGVPQWLAEILPIAYPSRSVEAYFGVQTSTGKQHAMVITAVALLGENLPAVSTLDDLEVLFSEEGDEQWINSLTATEMVAASQGGTSIPSTVRAASVDVDEIRTAFYEDVATEDSGRYWWWIQQIYIDPKVVIAGDESGEPWLVPYTLQPDADGDDPVSFGDPVEVYVQWVEKESGQVAAKVALPDKFGAPEAAFAAAAASRPADRQHQFNNNKEAKGTVPIDNALLAKTLGLPEDASEEQINEALAAKAEETSEETPEETPAETPEPTDEETPEETPEVETPEQIAASGKVVDLEAWKETTDYVASQRKKEREDFVQAAVSDRKIPPSRKAHYLSLMERDETGTREFINKLEKNAVPGGEVGTSDSEATFASAKGTGLFPELDAARAAKEG